MALAARDAVLDLAQLDIAHGQAEALLPLIDGMMRRAGLPARALALVAVTTGPGSFTGIRVGLAAARGIALALDVPVIGVTGFEAALAALGDDVRQAQLLLVALESRRAELFIQLFDAARHPLGAAAALLPDALAQTVAAAGVKPLAVTGDAAPRAAAALATYGFSSTVATGDPRVLGALRVAWRRWRRGEPQVAVRPFYLRPPDVTVAGGPPRPT